MKVLAIDTSTTTARVAVVDDQGTLLASGARTAERHSTGLLSLCDEVFRSAGVRVGDVDAFACGAGPGSFTGLRVGLATIKGFALATGRPIVMVSSLAALADDLAAVSAAPVVVPCLDAGKGEVYAQTFAGGGATSEEWRVRPEELVARMSHTSFVIGGSGAVKHRAALASLGEAVVDVAGPTAESIGRRAMVRLARGEQDDVDASVPSYGRAPDITMPKRR